ncbi:type II secretion system minor pseudopilin GspI [Rheinheimera sp. SA_1]|uniref:type II secretion system minor pseudopilin GspI n=1 Tax=Rheinheimera sp. SA_1 TaxID=1827365 RepID=UPI000A7FA7FB|nr:type II secretion system minor pseudopilin GspI [Rheinheimera sp. SA_1]
MNGNRPATKGFTLIELLVAMAIFAIAGVAVMRATTEHIRAVTQLEEMTIVSFIAENQLQLAKLEKKWPPEKSLQGEVTMANRNWVWVQQSIETPDPNFRQLKVSVSPADEPARVLYSLQTFVGKADE